MKPLKIKYEDDDLETQLQLQIITLGETMWVLVHSIVYSLWIAVLPMGISRECAVI